MIAILDASGVLAGFSHDQTADGVKVPDDCDLAPGKYVWSNGAFHPVLSAFNPNGPAPSFEAAVIKALASLRDSGSAFPPDVAAWLSSEEKTLKSVGRW
jgi:hypothetical protein